jgi:hypothetical protein
LSKSLLSDRLTVKVGNNFELEGPKPTGNKASALAGDVALDYRLSRDGSYVLRGYRRNVYQGVVEGYIIETGLSFIITVDFNKVGELLHKKRRSRLNETISQSTIQRAHPQVAKVKFNHQQIKVYSR